MNREPIGLYVFRFVLGFGLFAFMAMLYWSSLLLEEDVKRVHQELEKIKEDVYAVRAGVQQIHRDVLEAVIEDQKSQNALMKDLMRKRAVVHKPLEETKEEEVEEIEEVALTPPEEKGRPYLAPDASNLLKPDPFYTKTLPALLPKGFRPWGERRAATVGKPESLHPFSGWSSVSSWNGLCTVNCAQMHFGKYEMFGPDMAVKIEKRVNPELKREEFWVHLRDNVYWRPLEPEHFPDEVVLAAHFRRKHKVTAHDFKFFWDALMNPHNQAAGAVSLRNYLGDVEEIRVIDDLTFAVRWAAEPVVIPGEGKVERTKYIAEMWTGNLRPLPRFVYQYFADGTKIVEDDEDPDTYRTNSVWAQNFANHWAKNVIVSCGPWIFDGMTDQSISFRRNPDHYNPLAVLVEELIVSFRESPDAIWQDFKAGKIDSYEIMPDQLVELDEFLQSPEYQAQKKGGKGIQRLDYMSRAYNYIGWNQERPFFKSPELRQAMTMAIDRERIIDQNLNGMAAIITGPFYRYSPSYNRDVKPWPYDPSEAESILEREGWFDADGDGIREKVVNGQNIPFRFKLTYYVKNPNSKANADYVATALREIGVDCQLNGVDIADLSAAFDDKSFDAIYLGWALGTPPEEPRQLWHSAGAKQKGSSNAVGFANSEADTIIDRLQFEYDKGERLKLYHRFHQIIHGEAPYTFLYTPKSLMLYREYVQNVFIPAERQDLIPGANVAQPDSSIFWLKKTEGNG